MARRPKLRTILASNIRAASARRNTSTAALAGLADVSVAHLYDVLNGKKAATIDFVEKVAAELHVEPWELLRSPKDEPARSESGGDRPRRRRSAAPDESGSSG